MRKALRLMSILTLLTAAACSSGSIHENDLPQDAEQALAWSTDLRIYSLEPAATPETHKKNLHGYKILGSVELAGGDAQNMTRYYLNHIPMNYTGASGCLSQPRHALRLATQDGTVYEFLTCFTCGTLHIYKDGKPYWAGMIVGDPDYPNKVLKAHHVKLAAKYNK